MIHTVRELEQFSYAMRLGARQSHTTTKRRPSLDGNFEVDVTLFQKGNNKFV